MGPPKKKRSKCRERGNSRSRRDSSEDSQPEDRVKEHQSSRRNSETSQKETKMKDNLETIRKKMAEQMRLHEEEIKQLKEELRKKDLEAKSKEYTTPPVKKSPQIEKITEENCSRLSELYPGMLVNEDGSLTRTPLSEAWGKYKDHQLEKRHETRPLKEG